jgi:hypothetical protein
MWACPSLRSGRAATGFASLRQSPRFAALRFGAVPAACKAAALRIPHAERQDTIKKIGNPLVAYFFIYFGFLHHTAHAAIYITFLFFGFFNYQAVGC